MLKWIRQIFQTKPREFPKDTSWMLTQDMNINIKNIQQCREFMVLKKVKQNPLWHGEGSAWNHTLLVTKEMHKIINNQLNNISPRDKQILMIAALCHDLGKATTTYWDDNEKTWKCKNHGAVGEKITRNLLINEKDYWLREEVCWLVRWHMSFHHILEKNHTNRYEELIRLSQGNSSIEKLLWLNVADSLGSKPSKKPEKTIDERFNQIKDLAEAHDCYNKPYHSSKSKSPYTMYVMIGIPGCGKDAYIKKFLRNVETICRDDIREEITYGNVEGRKLYLDNTKEAIVTDIVNSKIKKCCEEKRSFIINQTNIKKKYRTQLKETAFKYGSPNIAYIYVEAPSVEECKERRGHGRWDSIIDRMWNDFEFPDRSECDSFVFFKQTSTTAKLKI